MRKILLDTNAYTRLLSGDELILEELGRADKIFIPVIVLGELFAGFKGGRKESENKKILEKFLAKARVEMTVVNRETAEIFGEVKHTLSRAGTPIPINDVWISACSIETGSLLITYDTHFLKIPGLRVWSTIKN